MGEKMEQMDDDVEQVSALLAREHPAVVRNENGETISAGFATSKDMGGRVWVQYRKPPFMGILSEEMMAERCRVVEGYAKTLRRGGCRVTNGSKTSYPCLVVRPTAK